MTILPIGRTAGVLDRCRLFGNKNVNPLDLSELEIKIIIIRGYILGEYYLK